VGDHPFGFGSVVVRRDEQERVGAGVDGAAGEADRLVGRVAARAGDDRHVAVRGVGHGLDHFDVFVVGEGGALAGGADGDEAVDATVDEAAGVVAESVEIDASVVGERRRHRGEDAVEGCREFHLSSVGVGERAVLPTAARHGCAMPASNLVVGCAAFTREGDGAPGGDGRSGGSANHISDWEPQG